MATIGSSEAKAHFSALLDMAKNGEQITIIRHGVPVAVLEPVGKAAGMSVAEAIDTITEIGKGKSLGGLSIGQLIDEGRPGALRFEP